MINDNFARKAKVKNVIDGDTLEVVIDLGFYVTVTERIRLLRVNCPEVKGETRIAGERSKLFTLGEVYGKDVVIISHKTDSFKRWLAEVIYINDDGIEANLSDELLKRGLAVEFMIDKQ